MGALVFASVAEPDACADVWTWEHSVHPCCRLSNQTRWTGPNGDCCDYGSVEARDPFGSSAAISTPPLVFTRLPAPHVLAPSPAAAGRALPDDLPERPPDRIRAVTVLLI